MKRPKNRRGHANLCRATAAFETHASPTHLCVHEVAVRYQYGHDPRVEVVQKTSQVGHCQGRAWMTTRHEQYISKIVPLGIDNVTGT